MVRTERQYRYIVGVYLSVILVLVNLIVVLGQTEEVKEKEVAAEKLVAEAKQLFDLASIDQHKKYDGFLKLREAFKLLKECGGNSKEAIICVEMGKMFDQQEPKDGSSMEFYQHAAEVFGKLELYFEEAKVYRLMAEKCEKVRNDHYDSLDYIRRANRLEHQHIDDLPAVESLGLVKKIYIDPLGEDDWSKEFEVMLKNKIVNILEIVEFREQADAILKVKKVEVEKDLILVNSKGKIFWEVENFRDKKKPPNLVVKRLINSLMAEINKERVDSPRAGRVAEKLIKKRGF